MKSLTPIVTRIHKCYLCRVQNGKLHNPTCKRHNFCSDCLNLKINTVSSDFCEDCQKYFKSLTRGQLKDSILCATCTIFPKKSTWCKIHNYCHPCRDFLLNSNGSQIAVVNSCQECFFYFNSSNLRNNPARPIDRKANKLPRSEKNIARKAGMEIEYELKSPKSSNKNREVYHRVSNNPTVLPKNPGEKRMRSVIRITDRATVHKIVNYMVRCRDQSPIIDQFKKLESLNVSTQSFHTKCSICNSTTNITGFMCNHNLCTECLVYTGISQINNFFEFYNKDFRIAFVNFSYRCPAEGCKSDINLPTPIIIKNLNHYLDRDLQRFRFFSKYHSQDLTRWVSYFDGIDFEDI